MVDTLAHLRTLPQFNGRAAAMGFCYGGPYAILGPKRLGYDAGLSCHGTQMLDYLPELDGVTQPVCIMWGDQDHQAPAPVLDAYRAGAVAHDERRGAHLPGHPARLHDAGEPEGVRCARRGRSRCRARLSILEGLRGAKARRIEAAE